MTIPLFCRITSRIRLDTEGGDCKRLDYPGCDQPAVLLSVCVVGSGATKAVVGAEDGNVAIKIGQQHQGEA